MRVSFNQPAFIPWGGFFARLVRSDRMVLLDETILGRGFSYVNRNRLKGPEGEVWITVPLRGKGRGPQRIRDLEIHDKDRWGRKFLLTLRHDYGNSVHFEALFSRLGDAAAASGDSFMSLAAGLLRILREAFGITPDFILQSELGLTGKGTSLLVSIAREAGADEVILPYGANKAVDVAQFTKEGIRVFLLRYLPVPYPQFWGGFRANLSALDLLLCAGRDGRGIIERGARLLAAG
jgi:hypothetical protein